MLQMEDSDANQTLSLLKVKEALEDAGVKTPTPDKKKNIGCVLGNVGGSKASHEFYSRLNYVVVEKVLRRHGRAEEDVRGCGRPSTRRTSPSGGSTPSPASSAT